MAPAQASARPQSLSTLLETLNTCLSTTASSLPKSHKDAPSDVTIEPPQDGISLLDTKSEILLSYLQNLVFLIIFQLRNVSAKQSPKEKSQSTENSLEDDIRKKLIELRVFLERGVRPLEGRLKYQVDKVIKAAEDAERTEKAQPTKTKKTRKVATSDSEASSDEDEDASGSENDEDIDEMAYRPNVSAFAKGVAEKKKAQPSKGAAAEGPGDGIYRPPRIMPTSLPTTERRERQDRRPIRSNVIDEFVSAEMSSAPMAEPSIGSTIIDGGRTVKSKKDREREAERTTYEETNFVRLPKQTKKELAKKGFGKDGTYGGDEWKGLNEGADNIERLTRKSKSSGALEKSRKRVRNEDGQRGDGVGMGQFFDKRRKKVDTWKR
ncbi:Sas10/Utp3/C1D [Penicillium concentricum]|uniref:Sas10/Utp3/C1D n=1 Tax=Penicillium concentricum TaxID=293559 RepID=A0A9W9VBC8_9EURO|nr:Sas10/Utp3/C1D [Penicillium concentricum]KAJ5374454.1 Sas10/Utp3/C1D [Penicillium concentricum]